MKRFRVDGRAIDEVRSASTQSAEHLQVVDQASISGGLAMPKLVLGLCLDARNWLAVALTFLLLVPGAADRAQAQPAGAEGPVPYRQPSPVTPVTVDAVIDLAGQRSGKPFVVTQFQQDAREEIPQNWPASFFGSYAVDGQFFFCTATLVGSRSCAPRRTRPRSSAPRGGRTATRTAGST